MKKLALGVDCDDVIIQLQQSFLEWHNETYGTNHLFESLTTYDFISFLGVPQEEVVIRFDAFFEDHHHNLPPEDGAIEGLHQLSQHYELHMVTSRCFSTHHKTTAWLQAHQVEYVFTELNFVNSYTDLHPRRTKLEMCQQIGAVAMIEDAPSHGLQLANAGIAVVKPKRPWNQSVEHPLIHLVDDWVSVVATLQKLHGWS